MIASHPATVTVAVAQFAPGPDTAENLKNISRLAATARDRGAELVLFPEYSAYFSAPFTAETRRGAQGLEGEFIRALGAVAREHSLWLVVGLLEARPDAPEPGMCNTVVALGPDGAIHARYRKAHLYDAFGYRESEFVLPGEITPPETFRINGLCFGLQTCYDLRFPEVSRTLIDAGADVLLVPAQWVPGPLKEHAWNTLLAARAIENTAYVVASDHPLPAGIGLAQILDPAGIPLAGLGTEAGVVLAELSAAEITRVRAQNPALALRRFAVTPREGTAPTRTGGRAE